MIKVTMKFKNIDEYKAFSEMLRTGFKEETGNARFFSDDERGIFLAKVYTKALLALSGNMEVIEDETSK